jgi:hypothetical protein
MRSIALLALLGGCSFFATEGPRPPPGPTACNRDSRPIVGDAIVAVGAAFAAGVASLSHASGSDTSVALGVSGVFAASTAYGYVEVHRCRAEHVKRPGWSLAEMPAVM